MAKPRFLVGARKPVIKWRACLGGQLQAAPFPFACPENEIGPGHLNRMVLEHEKPGFRIKLRRRIGGRGQCLKAKQPNGGKRRKKRASSFIGPL